MSFEQLLFDYLLKKEINSKNLLEFKKIYAQKAEIRFSKNSDISAVYKKLIAKNKIKGSPEIEELLKIRKVRTLSGVAPVAVLTKPYPCPGKCSYCPQEKNIPKSYLSDEPVVLRARLCHFDAYKQIKLRLQQYEKTGHCPEKVELIVLGGTWSALPKNYQLSFLVDCFRACNGLKIKKSEIEVQKSNSEYEILKLLQRQNENAKYRIVGLTLETRPDYINEKEIEFMRFLGTTRVELGVQSIYDDVLIKIRRGHTVKETIKATKLLKDAGFKICYHLMPNLPGSNFERDLKMFKTIYNDERFRPDMIKIYPCVVTKGTLLYQWYKKGQFKPYSDEQLINLLIKIKKITPYWVRINRLYRDIPAPHIIAGSKISNIRQLLKSANCQCIRCREIKSAKINESKEKLKLKINKYLAAGGQEYFLQYVDSLNRLYSLLRLRIADKKAIIREVHTFGQALAIGEKSDKIQHSGLGKKLIEKSPRNLPSKKIKKLTVISGVGVRGYYRQLGFKLQNTYMVKYL